MQNKIVGVFDPSYAEDNRVKKSRVYMNRLAEDALVKQSNDSKSFCEQKDPIKALEELFMGMKSEESKTTEGIKHNEDKLPLDIVLTRQFPKALNAVCQATMFGHNKYKDTDTDFLNFKKVLGGSQTYADALQRHSVDKGTIALDSGLPHIFHKCWNALAELELWIEENKFGSLK